MAPSPIFCSEKRRLLEDFQTAVSDCNILQTSQIAALIKGRGMPFEAEIVAARERRDRIKDAILAHQELHGCGR